MTIKLIILNRLGSSLVFLISLIFAGCVESSGPSLDNASTKVNSITEDSGNSRVDSVPSNFLVSTNVPTQSATLPVLDFRTVYPLTTNKILKYRIYNDVNVVNYPPGELARAAYEMTSWDTWNNNLGKAFVMHRARGWDGSSGDSNPHGPHWCPDLLVGSYGQFAGRTDDVYQWSGNNLYYTDTFDFSLLDRSELNNSTARVGLYTQHLSPGHFWATRWMTLNNAYQSYHQSRDKTFEDPAGCAIGNIQYEFTTPISSNTVWKALYSQINGNPIFAWAPITGGSALPKRVLRLDEVTFFGGNPCTTTSCDMFKEEWYYYWDQSGDILGTRKYVPIVTIGRRKRLNISDVPNIPEYIMWFQRLESVTAR